MTRTEELLRDALTAHAAAVPVSPDAWVANTRRLPKDRRRRVVGYSAFVLAACVAALLATVVVPRTLGYQDPLSAGPHSGPLALHRVPADQYTEAGGSGVTTSATWVSDVVQTRPGINGQWFVEDEPVLGDGCVGIAPPASTTLSFLACGATDQRLPIESTFRNVTVHWVLADPRTSFARTAPEDGFDQPAVLRLGDTGRQYVVFLTNDGGEGCAARELKEFDASGRRIATVTGFNSCTTPAG